MDRKTGLFRVLVGALVCFARDRAKHVATGLRGSCHLQIFSLAHSKIVTLSLAR